MAIFDNPSPSEIDEMIEFCRNHKYIYIYGANHVALMIGKYLDMCGENIYEGYVISDDFKQANDSEYSFIFQVAEKHEHNKEEVGFLLTIPDKWNNIILKNLAKYNFGLDNVYVLSEHNKRTIAHKMIPREKERMMIEVNLVDHCNLNCQMCDHFAQLAEPTFLDLEIFRSDMKRLAEISDGYIDLIKLQGGEPLLNNNLIEYFKIAREYLPNTRMFLFTDGVLLRQWEKSEHGNLWQAMHDYDIELQLTLYPIKLNVEEITNLANKYKVEMKTFSEIAQRNSTCEKRSVKHPFRLEGDVDRWSFVSCYQFNESISLRHGKLYTCPMIPYVRHFNKHFNTNLIETENDYIDIHKDVTYDELAEFLTHRTDFCSYCDVRNRRSFPWKISSRSIEEYVD